MIEAFIKRIDTIKGFGSFDDYAWDVNLDDFARYNLIYGWNGSGKTTLSRVLRCYETGEIPSSRGNASIAIKNSQNSGIKSDYSIFLRRIKVFNRDYIAKNIHWEQGNAQQLVYVGEQQIEDKKTIDDLRDDLKTKEEEFSTASEVKNRSDKTLNSFTTDKAKEIREHLSLPQAQYTKTHLNKDLDKISEGFVPQKLSEEDLRNTKKAILSTNDKAKENQFRAIDISLNTLANDVSSLVSTSVSVEVEIDELKTNYELKEWVGRGHKFHETRDECAYCDNEIKAERKKLLDKYFNKEQEELLGNINDKISEIKQISDDFVKEHVDSSRLFSQFVNPYNAAKEELTNAQEVIVDKLKGLVLALEDKQKNIEKESTASEKIFSVDWISITCEYISSVKKLNKIIDTHNKAVDNFDAEVVNAQDKIKQHYLADSIEKRKELLLENEQNSTTQNAAKQERDSLLEQVRTLEAKQSNVTSAAEHINNLLKLMGHPHIRLEPYEGGYQLLRNGYKVDDNLSEGEKTAITFAHFIASLGNHDFNIEESIIVIDDPISSLDSNVLYSVFAVIKAYTKSAKQLFLMTHHHGFFTLLLTWIKHEKVGKSRFYGLYNVQRNFDEETGEPISTLCMQDKFLQKYDSEYHYLFTILYKFELENKDKEINLEDAYPYLNIARKFLEIFLRFKYPHISSMSGVFNEIEKDHQESITFIRKVRAIVMDGSHASIDSIHELPQPLTPENAKVLSKVTELIQVVDSTHWQRLTDLFKEQAEIIDFKAAS